LWTVTSARRQDQGFFAEDVAAGLESRGHQHRVQSRRRADVDEVQRLGGEKDLARVVPPRLRKSREQRIPAIRTGVRRRGDRHVRTAAPSGNVAVSGNVPDADDCTAKHGSIQSVT
jgi:hypothetical protein